MGRVGASAVGGALARLLWGGGGRGWDWNAAEREPPVALIRTRGGASGEQATVALSPGDAPIAAIIFAVDGAARAQGSMRGAQQPLVEEANATRLGLQAAAFVGTPRGYI